MDDDVLQGIVQSGFCRYMAPVARGGLGGSWTELAPRIERLAECSASAGWVASLLANGSRLASLLPESAQSEVWAATPDVLISAALVPMGQARRERHGWRITGRWPLVTFARRSAYLLVATAPVDGYPRGLMALVPRERVAVEAGQPQQAFVGLLATETEPTVVDALVSTDHVVDRDVILQGRRHVLDPSASLPLQAASTIFLGAPAVGAGRGALRAFLTLIAEKITTSDRESSAVERGRYTDACSEAALLLRLASHNVDQASRLADEQTRGEWQAAVVARDMTYAVVLARRAVDLMTEALGSAALTEPTFAGPALDVRTIAAHGTLRVSDKARDYFDAASRYPGGRSIDAILMDSESRARSSFA